MNADQSLTWRLFVKSKYLILYSIQLFINCIVNNKLNIYTVKTVPWNQNVVLRVYYIIFKFLSKKKTCQKRNKFSKREKVSQVLNLLWFCLSPIFLDHFSLAYSLAFRPWLKGPGGTSGFSDHLSLNEALYGQPRFNLLSPAWTINKLKIKQYLLKRFVYRKWWEGRD